MDLGTSTDLAGPLPWSTGPLGPDGVLAGH